MRNRRDKLLGVAAVITFIIGGLNAIDYFLFDKNWLRVYHGKVETYDYSTYSNKRGKLSGKSMMKLEGINRKFFYKDRVYDGAYFGVEEGDTVTVFAKRRIQYLYTFDFASNVVYIQKKGTEIFNGKESWKEVTFLFMCVFGGCSFLLSVIYLDIVKGISLENWFQGKILKNPAYLNKRKRR